ncbi:MAG: YIP1 family protein [Chloroflexota bacterium]|nr:YIP1 family protein [Chloroflexota bacterium]
MQAVVASQLRQAPDWPTEVQSSPANDIDVRIRRALRLDRSLYSDIARHGVGGRQALKVILITALFAGLLEVSSSYSSIFPSASADNPAPRAPILQLPVLFLVPAITQLAAWLTWTFLLWSIGTRWRPREGQPPSFRNIARALALAQAPILVAPVLIPLSNVLASVTALIPVEVPGDSVQLPGSWSTGVINAWVLAGSFLAMREVLRLSSARTLLALLSAGLLIAALFGAVVVLISAVAGREAVGLYALYPPGFKSAALSAEDIAYRFDFNLGFLGLTDGLLYYLSVSILHPFAAAGAT